jgi:hypothetical protein
MQSETAAHDSTVDERVATESATLEIGVNARTLGAWRMFGFGGHTSSAVSSPYRRSATGEAHSYR